MNNSTNNHNKTVIHIESQFSSYKTLLFFVPKIKFCNAFCKILRYIFLHKTAMEITVGVHIQLSFYYNIRLQCMVPINQLNSHNPSSM